MNAISAFAPAALKAGFPGLAGGWHYLDTAATAQKPQAVIDATVRAMGADYATVHRGVYARSADMTLAFEAAREKVASLIGAPAQELVFTRGATEAINLVAYSYPKKGRVLLSLLEHHSNIVPWQLAGWQIDVCPLTADGQIDLDAAEAMLTPEHTMVAFAHVSNVLGSVLDARRAAELAHRVGAKLLLDGCQAVPRLEIDVAELGCDFYAFSSHKLYGPTGIGALWGRAALLDAMPPWQGGGAMIDRVSFAGTTYALPPQRFEAGTPAIIEAIGFGAAADYVRSVGLAAIHAHETALVSSLRAALRSFAKPLSEPSNASRTARKSSAMRSPFCISARSPASDSSSPSCGANRRNSVTACSSHSRSRAAFSSASRALSSFALASCHAAKSPDTDAVSQRPKASSSARWPRGFRRPRSWLMMMTVWGYFCR